MRLAVAFYRPDGPERHDWEQRRERPPVRLGAPIDAGAAVAGLGWGLLILLLPLVAARRRTMF